MKLKPFFTFFGGKWRAAPYYPPPKYEHIIESFAGSAGYSGLYADRKVVLVDKDPFVVGTWRYLIHVTESEIRSLPLKFDTTDALRVPQEAKWLIGWWLNKGSAAPCKTPSYWMRASTQGDGYKGRVLASSWWGAEIRERIASQLSSIRHWQVIEGDYSLAPSIEATWFIDPPYQAAGRNYRMNKIDYPALATWCRSRLGQVLVCEANGATWLPFKPFRDIKVSEGKRGGKRSLEVLWDRLEPPELE